MTHILDATTSPAIINERPYIGDTWRGQIVSFRNDSGLIDVSADAFSLVLEDAAGTAILTLTLGDGIEFSGDGIIWEFTAAQTADFVKDARWAYSLKWTKDSDGTVKTIIAGTVIPQRYTVNN